MDDNFSYIEKETQKEKKFIPILFCAVTIFFLGGMVIGGLMVRSAEKELHERIEREQEERKGNVTYSQKDTLDDWAILQMAIVMTESEFNPNAVGKDEDWGIFQQVPIYVAECNRILSLRKSEERYVHEDSFDVVKAIEMFNLLQSHYNPEKDIDTAIRYQNKASWYKKKVYKNIIFIKQMEEVRRNLREI